MMKQLLYLGIALAGVNLTSAQAQSTFTGPLTATGGYINISWNPTDDFTVTAGGQTTEVYFWVGDPAGPFGPLPSTLSANGSGVNFITSGEEAYGTTLSSSSSFGSGYFNLQGDENDAYAGIDYNAGSGNYNFGWIEFSATSSSITVAAAYMDLNPNEAVQVGVTATPEPGTLALAGLGATSWFLIRRRK